ncbi:hypothetical protein FGG78_43400, partial [Thioclava sp. BHET1]
MDHPYGNGTTQKCTTKTTGPWWNQQTTTTCQTIAENGTAVQWSWAQVWATYPVYYFFNNYVQPALGNSQASSMYNDALKTTSNAQMDSNLSTICSAAKANGVTIYSI